MRVGQQDGLHSTAIDAHTIGHLQQLFVLRQVARILEVCMEHALHERIYSIGMLLGAPLYQAMSIHRVDDSSRVVELNVHAIRRRIQWVVRGAEPLHCLSPVLGHQVLYEVFPLRRNVQVEEEGLPPDLDR